MSVVMLTLMVAELAAVAPQSTESAVCQSWQECTELARSAAERGEYETFHTLAWRAVQTGPRNDPALMVMLARAQSLSGRPHDALVMLQRLAERGVVVPDLETSDDFRRVRTLRDRPALVERVGGSAATVATPPATVTAPANPAPPVAKDSGRLHVPAARLSPVSLTYDAVSRRFVIADAPSDTLKILDELSSNIVDLVRRRWAAPYRTSAIAIDSRRGDLWVVGTHNEDADGVSRSAVHRLQLVSGRLLGTVALPNERGAARFADVAVAGGTVFVLDAEGRRIFSLRAGATALRQQMTISGDAPLTSLCAADGAVVFVAHGKGIVRMDVDRKVSAPLRAPSNLNLGGFERLNWYDGSLVGVQSTPDRGKVAVRIRLNASGTRAVSSEILDTAASSAAAIVGDVYYYLGAGRDEIGSEIRRLPLQKEP